MKPRFQLRGFPFLFAFLSISIVIYHFFNILLRLIRQIAKQQQSSSDTTVIYRYHFHLYSLFVLRELESSGKTMIHNSFSVTMNFAVAIALLYLITVESWRVHSQEHKLMVNMTLVNNARETGAFCLDGSLPAYHLHRGIGAGENNWLLQFEGGGWCNDLKSCLERAQSRRGSTNYMTKYKTFSGILSNNSTVNPDFYNWNRVKLRYCDGASFTGNGVFNNGTTRLYFKGKKIWEAIIVDLLPKGLGKTRKALLSGCSAGGLATFHHCDNFTKYLPTSASVKCLSDAGFFLDGRDVNLNHTMRYFFKSVVSLQGAIQNLNINCTSSMSSYPDLSYVDKGPAIDAVVWYDGEVWRVALDTQSLEDDSDCGKLANFVPLTNYRTERKYGVFSKLDACAFVVNVYNDGNVLSIVTDSSPHGTHVAGIATAFHPEEPLLNGVAPGAQLISCKIGDSRLGSNHTGTGLTRALIAAVEHKCDLINMSYGVPTLLPDYGRFVDLVNDVVNKHRLIFVSSVGNNGPALSTVGAPGGTSSSIIGVGAYVSPAMAAGAHCVIEPPSEGLEYTWSSRGPTTDGDLGVCVSAPGGAIAPVPTWTLQRRMLKNGTSMSSPSACGGIALLISAMKEEGIPVSPYSVRKALENTSVPIGDSPEDKLSAGQGLMQVDKCYEYIQQSRNIPCVWYQININQSGKSNPSSRGIYLREANACQQSTEWTVHVDPKFHEDANKLEDLVVFEECIELHSSDSTVVKAPEYLLLTHNGRTFNIFVDPTNLCDGLHYYEVYGIDCKAPWRGPLFRIPITITKPVAVINRPPQVSFSEMLFEPGHIERKYIEVPHGASWVEGTMNISSFDTPRRFSVDTVQICPLQRPLKWRSDTTFSSPAAKNFTFKVVGGQTLELVIAQFWSSGIGSHETTNVDLKIVFHGIKASQEVIVLDGSEAPVRVDAEALLASEKLTPVANLNKIRVPYRPVDSKISALSNDRDKLPSGKQMLALTLTYKVKLDDGAKIKPQIPFLNGRIHDTKFESQFYMISDSNKRVYSRGDAYPKSTKLPKGEYSLQLYVRHEDLQILEKMKHLVLFIERKLEDKDIIRLSFFSKPDGPLMGNGSFKSSTLIPGIKEGFYLGPPPKDKLPKNSLQGSVLVGSISYGKLSFAGQGEHKNPEKHPASYRISYIVPPNKIDEDKGKTSLSSKKTVSERLEEEVRDAKIKVLGGIKQESDEDLLEWNKLSVLLKSEYPKYTPLLAKILEGLISRSNIKDKSHHHEEIINAANEVIDSIDREELAKKIALKSDLDDEEAQKTKKKMKSTQDQLAEALYQKGLALAEIESLKEVDNSPAAAATEGANPDEQSKDDGIHPDLFDENFKELKKWVDVKSTKYGILLVTHEKRSQRIGTALKVLTDIIQDDTQPAKKKLYELKLSLLEEIGWTHLATYERQWMLVRFPPSLPLF